MNNRWSLAPQGDECPEVESTQYCESPTIATSTKMLQVRSDNDETAHVQATWHLPFYRSVPLGRTLIRRRVIPILHPADEAQVTIGEVEFTPHQKRVAHEQTIRLAG